MSSSFTYSATVKKVSDLDINPRIISAAKKGGYLTAWSVLRANHNEVEKKTQLSVTDVEQLTAACADCLAPSVISSWKLYIEPNSKHKMLFITTGCAKMDNLLGGGIPVRGVTEIAGESGSGKTQFGLQLAILAQLPLSHGGLGKGVAYICTECQFPVHRLEQLINHYQKQKTSFPKSYSDNIFIHHVSDMDSLVDCIQYQLPQLVLKRNVGLVVIDSVAASFRAEDGNEVNKTIPLQSLGYRLHQLASIHNIAVVAINQVTAVMKNINLYGMMGSVMPALGLAWSNLLRTRLMLRRTSFRVKGYQLQAKPEGLGNIHSSTSFANTSRLKSDISKNQILTSDLGNDVNNMISVEYRIRSLEVVFCPWLARGLCHYLVTDKGLEDVEIDNVELYSGDNELYSGDC